MVTKVKLVYFKESGKYYTDSTFISEFNLHHHQIIDEIKDYARRRRLIGLMEGHSNYRILVTNYSESEEQNFVPHLIDMFEMDKDGETDNGKV